MAYALFAHRKIVLTAQLNTVSLRQTQRSNEQYNLATQTLSLQQQLSSLQAAQAFELSDYYELLSYTKSSSDDNEGGLSDNFFEKHPKDQLSSDFPSDIVDLINSGNISRDTINAKIKEIEQKNEVEMDEINRKIYLVSVKENAIEMEVKRLDTQVSALQKQLEAIEDAESDAIDRATPKFNA